MTARGSDHYLRRHSGCLWDRDAYRARVGEDEAVRRRGAIMAEQWGYQLAGQLKRLGFTQAGLAEIMGVTPGRVSQIEHGEVSTVEALASNVAALGGKLELIADIVDGFDGAGERERQLSRSGDPLSETTACGRLGGVVLAGAEMTSGEVSIADRVSRWIGIRDFVCPRAVPAVI
jgi:transcriptional regulator with XRE-family HTH domain